MSRMLQVKAIPNIWIAGNGHRLDCNPYISGAIEAREQLKRHHTERLDSLTYGYKGGIFNGPRFARQYVNSIEHGIPFLGSTDILDTDFTHLLLISKKQVALSPELVIEKGWTLITCSGTIGRTVYSRTDMCGMAGSQHFMRVVPNIEKIKAGFLYSFLSCRYGVPMIVSGTHGAIIQHIEPRDLANLPVPRLGAVEQQVHDMVQRAADLRVEASRILKKAATDLELEIGGGMLTAWKYRHVQSFAVGTSIISNPFKRLDAFHYIGYVDEAIAKAVVPLVEVGEYAKSLRPPIMKRNRVTKSGYEFLNVSELASLEQRSNTKISIQSPDIDKFIVHSGYVLFQCVGQRYGLFGRPVLTNRAIIGKAVTEAVMRLIPNDPRDAGYISVYLATEFGQRLVMRHSAGTSIPVLQEDGAERILVYWPDANKRHSISKVAEQAWENRALATELEDQARNLVERAIEDGWK